MALSDVNDALQTYLGSLYVNDFNLFGRTYQVTAQADADFRLRTEDIAKLKTRNAAGDMVPHRHARGRARNHRPGQSHSLQPVSRRRHQRRRATRGEFRPGHRASPKTRREGTAARHGLRVDRTDVPGNLAGNTIVFIFPLCVVLVFLTLAAQYESWSLPLAIILIVPMCLLSAIAGVWLRGMDNNIFTQIGLIVLVGLASKNAILIVEFARQLEDTGKSITDAAIEAARLRLRPILMTSFAFILGVVPLVIASGAGAEMRQALGHGRVLWDAGRDILRPDPHAGVLRRHPQNGGTKEIRGRDSAQPHVRRILAEVSQFGVHL